MRNTADNNDDPLHHINYNWTGGRTRARVSQTKSNVHKKVLKAQSKKIVVQLCFNISIETKTKTEWFETAVLSWL